MKSILKQMSAVAVAVAAASTISAFGQNLKVSPADGAILNELSTITIDMPYESWEIADASQIAVKSDDNAQDYAIEVSEAGDFSFIGGVIIQLAEPITAPGSYKLAVGDGALVADGAAVAAFECNYTIVEQGTWQGTVTIDPAEGQVDALSEFNIVFEDVTTIAVDEFIGPKDFPAMYYYNIEENKLGKAYSKTCGHYEEGNVLNVWVNGGISDPGYYALVIPATFCVLDGNVLGAPLVFVYTVGDPTEVLVDYKMEITPADGATVEEIEGVTVAFDNVAKIVCNEYGFGPSIDRVDETTGEVVESYRVLYKTVSDYSFYVYLYQASWNVIDVEGLYRFTIPNDYVTVYGADGASQKVPETVSYFRYKKPSGIESVDADTSAPTYFDAKGRKVQNPQAGVYIKVQGDKSAKILK